MLCNPVGKAVCLSVSYNFHRVVRLVHGFHSVKFCVRREECSLFLRPLRKSVFKNHVELELTKCLHVRVNEARRLCRIEL